MGLDIKKVEDGWIVYNKKLGYMAHAHFQKRESCVQFIKLLKRGVKPCNEYFLSCAQRVLPYYQFEELR